MRGVGGLEGSAVGEDEPRVGRGEALGAAEEGGDEPRLDDKFFDIIPKSLAFKPMDNVKDFINKFVLSESRIDVESLKKNISLLDELENTLNKTKKQLDGLNNILRVFDEIDAKDRDIKVNEILLRLAERDALAFDIEKQKEDINIVGN